VDIFSPQQVLLKPQLNAKNKTVLLYPAILRVSKSLLREQQKEKNDSNKNKCIVHSLYENHGKNQNIDEKVQKVWLQNDQIIQTAEQKRTQTLDSDSMVLSRLRQTQRQDKKNIEPTGEKQQTQLEKLLKKDKIIVNVEDLKKEDPKYNLVEIDKILKKYGLPGTGRKPPNCIRIPNQYCASCGQVYLRSGSCSNPLCPDCATRWKYQRTTTAFHRGWSIKIEKKYRIGHIIASIPPELWPKIATGKELKKLKKELRRFLKNKGVKGGVMILHPYRIRDELKKILYDFIPKNDKGLGEYGLWKLLIQHIANWQDFIYFSPHFHIVGIYNWLENAKKGEPFVFKRLGDFSSPDDFIRCYMYQVSHAGISKNDKSHNINWFGELSTGNWSIGKATEKTQKYVYYLTRKHLNKFSEVDGETYKECPICKGELVDIYNVYEDLHLFDLSKQEKLKYAYNWAKGTIPPPNFEKLTWLVGCEK